MLWDRLSEADLLVFLDTPNALSSRWVEEELTRAHQIGTGTLQLIWPGHEKTAGTDFSTGFELEEADFDRDSLANGQPAPDGGGDA